MAPSPAVGVGAEDGGRIDNDVRSLFKAARKERGDGVGRSHGKKAMSKPQLRVTGEKLRGREERRKEGKGVMPPPPSAARTTEGESVASTAPNLGTMENKNMPLLPVGFFDDSEQDAWARGMNPIEMAAKEKKKDWDEFQSFAAEVVKAERDEEEAAVAEADGEGEVDVQQYSYEGRLASLLKRSEAGKNMLKPEDADVVAMEDELRRLGKESMMQEPVENASNEVHAVLLAKKHKRTAPDGGCEECAMEAAMGLMDWRSRCTHRSES